MSILTAVRHLIAVLASWLVTTLVGRLGLPVGPEEIAVLREAVTVLGMAVMLGVYAIVEKTLKPWFYRMGERPVPVPPPIPRRL